MICCQCKSSFYKSNIHIDNTSIDNIKEDTKLLICDFCKHTKCKNCFELKKIINYVHINNNRFSIDDNYSNNYQNNKNKKNKCFKCFIL